MAKPLNRSFLRCISIGALLLASGCGYQLTNPGTEKKVYVDSFVNDTRQPQIEMYLTGSVREQIVRHPGFALTGNKNRADIVVTGTVVKFEREPLFFSPSNSDIVIAARYTMTTEVRFRKGSQPPEVHTFKEDAAVDLTGAYLEESMLGKIAGQTADKIFFTLLRSYEKGLF